MSTTQPTRLRLPFDVMSDAVLEALAAPALVLSVSNDYESLLESATGQSEVLGIQRLLTIGRRGAPIRVEWQQAIAAKVVKSPSIFPLLCVLLLLQGAEHWVIDVDGVTTRLAMDGVRRRVFKHRLAKDMFADSDMVICADSLGEGFPPDLYEVQSSRLRTREDFETLVLDCIGAQRGNSSSAAGAYKYATALGVIVAELFENTDMHARLDLGGKPLKPNCMRGLIFKRVQVELPPAKPAARGAAPRQIDCFEVSVFDSGIGYYSSYTREPRGVTGAELSVEWKVLHNCLERHYHPELVDKRTGHRAMGLYEVLRAMQSLKGRIEFRTGRLYAYRTFLDGQLQAQMQPRSEYAHLAWPKPKLVDVEKKYFAIPSEHEELVGTSVRVLVPLD